MNVFLSRDHVVVDPVEPNIQHLSSKSKNGIAISFGVLAVVIIAFVAGFVLYKPERRYVVFRFLLLTSKRDDVHMIYKSYI